jgi:CRISPR system Cascade subunit CasA
MPFSLINDPWLPVRRAYSGAAVIRPSQITENIEADPVIAIDWPRADFRLASLEFLIGLLAIACPPTGPRDWPELYHNPPSPAVLEAAFAPLAFAFELDGDGPRFMQDFEDLDAGENDVANLLIEAPGEQTLKKNADLLNKRGQVLCLSRASAAMALFTLQTYAPGGGRGYRTGLRGGGPLTTLAIPPGQFPLPLWSMLWANVPTNQPVHIDELASILPWLKKTKTSEKDEKVHLEPGKNDRLAFWAMPRRIRLNFSLVEASETCDLTGLSDTVIVTSWRHKNYGESYENFEHPLSPRYKNTPKDDDWIFVHPQPRGIGYREFLGLIFTPHQASLTLQAAPTIIDYRRDRMAEAKTLGSAKWRILAAGYDIYNNMKVRDFVEAELPVIDVADPEQVQLYEESLAGLIKGADEVAMALRYAVSRALFSEGTKPDTSASLFNNLRAQFWQETEGAFYREAARAAGGTVKEDVSTAFLQSLRQTALRLFDEAAPITSSDRPDRVAHAAKWLGLALSGYGKAGSALFSALGLEAREVKPKRKQA